MSALYGLVGRSLSHSFSGKYFAERFQEEHIQNVEYRLFPLENIESLPRFLFQNIDLKGFNVTIPYKQSILPYLDEVDAIAGAVGAVNVVKVERVGGRTRLLGYNTDVIGFEKSLQKLDYQGKKCLLFGTGGAAAAVSYVLKEKHVAFEMVSRSAKENVLTYEELTPEMIAGHELLVNATPLGMYPEVEHRPHIPYEGITPSHLLMDLIYNPEMTAFMREGIVRGACAMNGMTMLVEQAVASRKIWGF